MGVAGDGKQGVFRRELDHIQTLFDRDYGTDGRSLLLINSDVSFKETPLATVTAIEHQLKGVAEKMDAENDILLIYLTSHGSADFKLVLDQPGLNLLDLSAEVLGDMVRSLPIKHKVIIVSACYSGGFIPELKAPHTMIMTAASPDKRSFGCSDNATMTYFGEAI